MIIVIVVIIMILVIIVIIEIKRIVVKMIIMTKMILMIMIIRRMIILIMISMIIRMVFHLVSAAGSLSNPRRSGIFFGVKVQGPTPDDGCTISSSVAVLSASRKPALSWYEAATHALPGKILSFLS